MILYAQTVRAEFLSRPNRFVALCRADGAVVRCHVKNTGRLRELLVPGIPVLLAPGENPARRTPYDLVATENRGYAVNIDSQATNPVFAEWARRGGFLSGLTELRPEQRYGDSRFDFAFVADGRAGYAEIKGVTLFEDNGLARFPDAPTERGVKHLRELIRARKAGLEAALCFVVQREEALAVAPNETTDPSFAAALREAAKAGVMLRAVCCRVFPEGMTAAREIPVWPEGREKP